MNFQAIKSKTGAKSYFYFSFLHSELLTDKKFWKKCPLTEYTQLHGAIQKNVYCFS